MRGKGHKSQHIPVNDKLLSFVKIYRIHLGKTPIPDPSEKEAFFISKSSGKPLKKLALYHYVKKVAFEASKRFSDNKLTENKLRKLSPHWLRHLLASHLDKDGVSATVIKSIMRHASIQTTQMYIHANDELKHNESQKIDMKSYREINKPENITQSILSMEFSYVFIAADEFTVRNLLDSIERNAFRGVRYEPTENKEIFFSSLKEKLKISKRFTLKYAIFCLSSQEIEKVKQIIIAESKIRLFKCEFI